MIIHIVKEGDTLSSIANRYGITRYWLAEINGIEGINCLAVGQALAIVFPLITHVVKPGETLYTVSRLYGTTVNNLYKNNLKLRGQSELVKGESLVIQIDRTPFGMTEVGGYAYPNIVSSVLDTSLPFMDTLIPFTYGFTLDGKLIKPEVSRLLERAEFYGTKTVLHLSTLDENQGFVVENATNLLSDKSLWSILLESIKEELYAKGYVGVDVDFEFIGSKNAAPYAEFIGFLRESLNPLGFTVTVALAPKTRDDQPGDLYEGHDYELLGAAANSVLLMAYEWGYTYGPPQAVAPVTNVRNVVEYAVTKIDRQKIYLGVPNYGYDFTIPYVQGQSKAPSVSTREAFELACKYNSTIEYDGNALSPYFYYTADNKTHVVWFEDVRSLRAKLFLPFEYGLKGVLYWNLDRENNQNLTVLNSYINSPEKQS